MDRRLLSRFATVVTVADYLVVTNLLSTDRLVVTREVGELLGTLQREPLTGAELTALADGRVDGTRLLSLLDSRGLLATEADDRRAEEVIRQLCEADDQSERNDHGPTGWMHRRYWQPVPLEVADLNSVRVDELRSLRILLIGGCVAQFTVDALVRAGLRRSLDVRVRLRWPREHGNLQWEVADTASDVVALQFPGEMFLARLWDNAALVTPVVRRQRVEALKRVITMRITELRESLRGAMGLVHNIAPPAISPFGRLDFHQPLGFRQIVAELNAHIDEQVRDCDQLFVVDVERLAVRHGAAHLMDDSVFPYGHHGGSVDPNIDEVHQLPQLGVLLAEEYLSCWEIYRSVHPVKCVVVDLDNTLWPGILADEGPGWPDRDSTGRWMHLGLHQALRILKERGVLLATCSKGDEAATMSAWAVLRHPLLLRPEDFVAHYINWRPKSENVRELSSRLGFASEQMLFLDDNPVERAEVARHVPGIRVLDTPVAGFRAHLLTRSSCESGRVTDEAGRRTETTRALLARDELATGMDPTEFLKELDIELDISLIGEDELERVAELLSRTTQFTITGLQLSEADLRAELASQGTVYVLRVRDRFAEYGLVGACLLRDGTVAALAISCRVIGLDVGPAFLSACLRDAGLVRPGTVGLLVETSRNTPARDLFTRTGFGPSGPGRFVLDDPGAVPPSGRTPHRLNVAPTIKR